MSYSEEEAAEVATDQSGKVSDANINAVGRSPNVIVIVCVYVSDLRLSFGVSLFQSVIAFLNGSGLQGLPNHVQISMNERPTTKFSTFIF